MPSSARGSPVRDPLTTVFLLCIYPIFFLLLSILHLIYHSCLKIIANVRWQRYIFKQARQRPNVLFQSWKLGLGLQSAGARTAEHASEERLLKRGNLVRTMGRLIGGERRDITFSLKASKKQQALAPRHLAVVFAKKPVRTMVLIYRALARHVMSRCEDSHTRQQKKEEEQMTFVLQSAYKVLHCSALLGIEEVTIYDEAGRLKKALSGKQEWILEQPLEQDWQESSQFQDQFEYHQQFNTPRSDSFASSACEVTPSLKEASSRNGLHERGDYFQTSKYAGSRLRVIASLPGCSSSSCRTSYSQAERISSNGSSFLDHVVQARIRLNLLSAEDGKKAIANAASKIASRQESLKVVEVKMIDSALQEQGYPTEPDLLIIHGGNRRVRTLHGFPPWLIRLCEIYYDQHASPHRPFSSVSFEDAIASFSRSEQRYGR